MSDRNPLKNLYLALSIEGLAVSAAMLFARGDPANAWLLGVSRTRLLLSVAVLVSVTAFAILFVAAVRRKPWEQRIRTALSNSIRKEYRYWVVVAVLGLMVFSGYYLFFLAGQIGDNFVRVRLERLQPLIIWLALFAAQGMYVLPKLRYGNDRQPVGAPEGLRRAWPWAFAFFLGLVVLVAASRIGLEPDKVGWDNPGAPLLFVQVALTVAAAGTIKTLLLRGVGMIGRGAARVQPDWFVAAVIWLSAVALWLPAPIEQTYFSPHPRAPNFEYYPYSDAGLHDIAAQNLILGEGYAPLAEKPLYSLFLAVTHLLFGQEYQVVVNVQTMLLALFPVVVYLLASRMHNRTAGVLAAGFIIVREWNAIAFSPQIRVSHSKLLMTDLPAAFLIAIFILALFRWLSSADSRPSRAVIAGGSLGMVLLIRSQAVIFLPVILFALLLVYGREWRVWFFQGAVFTLGAMVVILPWMVRNYLHTGIFGYSQPNQALYIAKQYSLTPEEADPGFPEEATLEDYTSLGFSKMWEFTRTYPAVVSGFVASHFMRNEISTLLIFPMSISDVAVDNAGPRFFDVDPFVWADCCSLRASMERYPFWGDWTGALSPENAAMIVVNLALISLGVAAAWRRWRLLGLLPLGLHYGYSLSVAIARVSGWRLILPVDWIAILYYCMGLAVLVAWLAAFFSGKSPAFPGREGEFAVVQPPNREVKRFSRRALMWLVLFAGLGSIVPLAEAVFPVRYATIENIGQLHEVEAFSDLVEIYPEIDEFMAAENAVAAVGKVLYPRYYREEQFEPGGKWPGNIYYPVSRLAFYLAGPDFSQVVLPLADPPQYFPNAADAALLGCRAEGYIRAFAVVVIDGSGRYLYLDRLPADAACSFADGSGD